MRLFLAAALCGLFVLCSPASAQNPAIAVTDPDAYATALSNSIAHNRMEPIRETFSRMMSGGQLDVQTEASVTAFERYLEGQTADRYGELEDMTLGGSIRRIYWLHTFDGRFLFTRYDFIRGSEGWMLSGLTFGSTWASVATASSPGWTPSSAAQ
jgi:hypothetical protein